MIRRQIVGYIIQAELGVHKVMMAKGTRILSVQPGAWGAIVCWAEAVRQFQGSPKEFPALMDSFAAPPEAVPDADQERFFKVVQAHEPVISNNREFCRFLGTCTFSVNGPSKSLHVYEVD